MNRLHSLLTRHGVAIPEEDLAYIATLERWMAKLKANRDRLAHQLEVPRKAYSQEARAKAEELTVGVASILTHAKKRGVFSMDSMPELVTRKLQALP